MQSKGFDHTRAMSKCGPYADRLQIRRLHSFEFHMLEYASGIAGRKFLERIEMFVR